MIDYWFVPRPKRKLNSVPEVLGVIAESSINKQWEGQRDTHLSLEEMLEHSGLKRVGERRDRGGSGARTYVAWLKSLGLVFEHKASNSLQLTLAGEAILSGRAPVSVLRNQIVKYQFPSSYSLLRNVDVSPRFKIRPFRFLLKLLLDDRIKYLTEDEVAKIVVVEAEKETETCYNHIVERILEYRDHGDSVLLNDYPARFGTTEGNLKDVANTLANWLEYTQLIERGIQGEGSFSIPEDKVEQVENILSSCPNFIDRPAEHEYFQRKYGLDPEHNRDNRNLAITQTITARMIAEMQIQRAFMTKALEGPISKISADLISSISQSTGLKEQLIEDVLNRRYPNGAVGTFLTRYYEMAFNGRDDATKFEEATVKLFREVFGYSAKHVGPIGLTPDVLIVTDTEGYQAIIDNKAYSRYTISNDHKNRMITNYIRGLDNYSSSPYPLAFFTYIAGGFGDTFDTQLKSIVEETHINGSGITASNIIRLAENNADHPYTHKAIRDLLSINRRVQLTDIAEL